MLLKEQVLLLLTGSLAKYSQISISVCILNSRNLKKNLVKETELEIAHKELNQHMKIQLTKTRVKYIPFFKNILHYRPKENKLY